MKYEILQEDINIMKRDMETNRTLKHLKNMSYYKFTIGDILIREDKYSLDWRPKLADCGLPYKYVYVFENELGVGYIRRLSINGRKFVDAPVCVMEFDPSQTRFTLDPEYADHLLLSPDDADFDAKSRYEEVKKKREQLHRKNKKAREPINNVAEAIAFLKKLKPGDQLWYGYSVTRINKEPIYVVSTTFGPLEHENILTYTWDPKMTVNATYGSYFRVTQLIHMNIFLTKPLSLEDVI